MVKPFYFVKLPLSFLTMSYSIFINSFFIIIISFSCFGQNQRVIDSLLLEITQRPNDELKVQAFNDLAWEHIRSNSTEAIGYAKKAISLSEELNYERGELEGINRLGTIAFQQKEYNVAIKYYKDLLKKEKKLKYQHGIGRAQSQLSNIYYKKGDLDNALRYAEESLKVFRNTNTENKDTSIATVLSTIGSIYTDMGFYDNAIKNLLQSLETREKLGDEVEIAKTLSKLGILSISIKEYLEAKKYLIKSLAISLKKEDKFAIARTYNNLGIVAYHLGVYDDAKEYYNKSLTLKTDLDILENDWLIYNNLGTLDLDLNNLDSALSNFRKAEQILKKQNIVHQIEVPLNIGVVFHRQKKYQDAITYYMNALQIADKSYITEIKILNNLQLCYTEINDFERALTYSQRTLQVNDSLVKEKRKAIQRLTDYEKQIELLGKDNKIKEGENKFRSLLNYGLAIGLLVVGLLFFVISRNKKQRQKIKFAQQQTEIEKQKATVAIQNQEIEKQKAQALLDSHELRFNQARLEGQEKERTRIAKDLHDRLGSMLSMVKVHYKSVEEQLDTLKDTNQKQYEKANTLLDEACEEVRKIANDINSGTLSKFGLIAALEDLTMSLNESKHITADLTIHGIDTQLDADTEIEIYRIIQELIHNILKHAFAKEVSIQLLQGEKGLNIMVEDDGVGFMYDTENITGMGLKNVASRVEKLEGELQVDSTLNNGTTIMIDIPINDINI